MILRWSGKSSNRTVMVENILECHKSAVS
jgi:hypothetical protein